MNIEKRQEATPVYPAIDKFVDEFSSYLTPRSTVLDVGSGQGRHSIHLARPGHRVVSLEYDRAAAALGQERSQELGISTRQHMSVNADVCKLPIRPRKVDAVLSTYLFAELPDKDAALTAIDNIQAATRDGGYHGIIAYIGTPQQQLLKPNLILFQPGELEDTYRARGWRVFQQSKPELQPMTRYKGFLLIRSRTAFVARKPKTIRPTYMNANREIIEL